MMGNPAQRSATRCSGGSKRWSDASRTRKSADGMAAAAVAASVAAVAVAVADADAPKSFSNTLPNCWIACPSIFTFSLKLSPSERVELGDAAEEVALAVDEVEKEEETELETADVSARLAVVDEGEADELTRASR